MSAAALVCVLAGLGGWWLNQSPTTLQVWFADVGQGDGIILRTPSQHIIVVDGGPQADFVREVDDHVPVSDRTIDVVVATHADADHVAGLTNLVASGRVRTVLMNRDASVTTKTYKRLLDAIAEQHVTVIEARAGQTWAFGEVQVQVLWPTAEGLATGKTTNERSVVLKVTYGNQDVLLTGDAPDSVEAQLTRQWGSALDVEVLKVGHHGSSHSSTADFLRVVTPELAVISAGAKNRYGHPGARVLADLAAVNATVLRTDERGDVLVACTVHACTVE